MCCVMGSTAAVGAGATGMGVGGSGVAFAGAPSTNGRAEREGAAKRREETN